MNWRKGRFIAYAVFRHSSSKMSWQSAVYDTVTKMSVFVSDLFFTPDELKVW